MKFKKPLIIIIGIYAIICVSLYLIQEKLLFHPTKLPKDYTFVFNNDFDEIDLKTNDGIILNAIHFKSKQKKGAVLFLHGNGGTINDWGHGYKLYTENGYDVLYLDYRGYGKSEGKIKSEPQLIEDAQLAYDHLKNDFLENEIIISGTSIGTGMATILASKNNPKKLLLNSPYSNLSKLILEKVKIVPKPIIKYKLESDKYFSEINCPIYSFHGDKDRIIPIHHSYKLKEKYDKIDLTILIGYGHSFPNSPEYVKKMNSILE